MRNIVDFEIYSRGNPKTLILVDHSELFEFPSNQIVEVQFPNLDTEIYKDYYNVDKHTVLSTKSLGYSPHNIDFPDGLYSIRVSFAPNKEVFKCKSYMKLDQAKQSLAELLSEKGCNEDISKVMELDYYITASEYLADEYPEKSIEMFKILQKKLKKLNCI